ncbi:MAG TPA: hypothetical protein VM369_10450, partial [Candidatus Binatia bacterium]|nr:hypothetical protein [Candidatus Binatia bacterium]
MKVRRRRVWTWLVTLGAGFVLLAAVASGMFQLAVQAMPGYRADIERYVSQVAARPVRIGAIALTWHYYYPSLDLSQVALMSSDGARPVLAVDRLRLGFALTRLVRADFMPDRLELSGLTLALRLDRDRHLHLDAMEEDDRDDQTDALRTLAGFAGLRIERCRLELRDERRPAAAPLVFGLDSAALTRGLLGRSLQARVTLPPAYGERAVLKGTFDGDLLEPSAWSGHFSAQVQSIAAGPWLAPYLAPGAHVQLSGANAQLDATLERGQARSLQLRLQADAVNAQRAQHRVAWTDLDAQLGATLEDEGWEVQLRRVALGGARGVWPRAGGILARHQAAAGGAVQWSLSADFLRLDDLAPWLSIARAPGRLEALSDATGEVRDLSASWQADEGDELR